MTESNRLTENEQAKLPNPEPPAPTPALKRIRLSFGKGAFGKQLRKKDKVAARIKAKRIKRREEENSTENSN